MSTERKVEFIECTKSEYENLSDKKDNTLYFTDDGDLYKGTTAYSENVQSDWNETQPASGAFIKNKPTIPTVGNGTVTIKQAGASKGTFTMNQSGDTTIELTDNNTDTKNTAGSTDTSSKIFLVGATSQAANPQTYSDNQVYAQNGQLNGNSMRVAEKVTMQYNASTESFDFVFE